MNKLETYKDPLLQDSLDDGEEWYWRIATTMDDIDFPVYALVEESSIDWDNLEENFKHYKHYVDSNVLISYMHHRRSMQLKMGWHETAAIGYNGIQQHVKELRGRAA